MRQFLTTATSACLLLCLLAPSPLAQKNAVLSQLRAKRLDLALAKMKSDGRKLRGAEALEAARLFTALSTTKAVSSSRAKSGLKAALGLLAGSFPKNLTGERHKIIADTGLAMGRLLVKKKLRPASLDHNLARTSLEKARTGVLNSTAKDTGKLREIDLLLIPIYRNLKYTASLLTVCREALTLGLSPQEKTLVSEAMGMGLLETGRVKQAIPLLQDFIRANPANPKVIGPIANALRPTDPLQAYQLLNKVINQDPSRKMVTAWTECLGLFYKIWKKLPKKKEPIFSRNRQQTIDLPVPRNWGGASWRSGYRTWRPDNTNPGKTYSGRHRVRAMIPLSNGWSRLSAPPPELSRWGNAAFCLRRGASGPTLVFYWFAPDLAYWYGTTSRTRGLTGKSARGQSKAGIVSIVTASCYGKKARERGQKFKSSGGTGLKLGIPSGVTRKNWSRGRNIYCENFFSIGQITGEVLLVTTKKDLELLKPELAWLFKNIKIK